jgi:hypothetical protein
MDIERSFEAVVAVAPTLLTGVDLTASAVFAVTGALVASRKQMDIIGFLWLGVVTGVGGGTLRDLLLGVPVFWVRDATPVIVCLVASAMVFFTAQFIQNRYRLILWLDAIGLGLFSVAGANTALEVGASPVIAVTMGVISATVGNGRGRRARYSWPGAVDPVAAGDLYYSGCAGGDRVRCAADDDAGSGRDDDHRVCRYVCGAGSSADIRVVAAWL